MGRLDGMGINLGNLSTLSHYQRGNFRELDISDWILKRML